VRTSWARSCAAGARGSRRPTWACRPARAGARRGCVARRWPSSPGSGRPGTPGSSRGATSARRTTSWTIWRAPCASRPTSARICSAWRTGSPRRARAPREEAPPSARRLLATLGIAPAYITGRRWDLLAWNAAAAAVFGDFGTLPEGERNLVRVIFTDGELRRRFVDWEGTARGVLALFRADRGRYADDPWFAEVIDDLRRVSPEFGRWWPRHDVRERAAGRKEVEHPTVGRLILEPSALHLAGFPDLTLVVYAPLPEQDTARKLQRLVRRGDPCSDAL